MATQQAQIKLSGLARRLVQDKLISEADAVKHHETAIKKKVPFVSLIVEKQAAKPRDIANCAAQEFGLPLMDLGTMEIDSEVVKLVKEQVIHQHHVLPLIKRGNRMFVAISDPTNFQGLEAIKFNTGLTIEGILVEEDKLTKIIESALAENDTSMMDMGDDEDLDNLDVESVDENAGDDSGSSSDADDTPVVRFVNKVLLDAINKGASDIHFEPYEKVYRVRLRQDGVLREVASPPVQLSGKIAARIKVMSRMDLAERRVPQDGRIKMRLSKTKSIDFRVNTCPTLFGEKIVLRILDASSAMLGIEVLGYEDEQRKLYEDALAKPYGMILVTGPTGSGKTVSLYTGLNILNTEDRNISTAEDPAEINLQGINQVNVNVRVGLTFSEALKAFLRQDPDIIMVGEIRDLDTAGIAIKAAQTGHLVLSTLHTNDAPQTLTRLMNMGVPAYNIANSISLIIAQRLARRLCKHCKKVENVPKDVLINEGFPKEAVEKGLKLYAAVGCDQCAGGYKGRVGIYQVMPITEGISQSILKGGNAMDIADQAEADGIPDLRKSGIKKVMDGLTSLEEINRVTKD